MTGDRVSEDGSIVSIAMKAVLLPSVWVFVDVLPQLAPKHVVCVFGRFC